jgi:hypothetical protein
MPLSALQGTLPKPAPKVALIQLDPATDEILRKAFEQSGIQTVSLGEDVARRLLTTRFEGCVVRLDDHAPENLETVRSSPSNRRTILYGILTKGLDVRSDLHPVAKIKSNQISITLER